MEPHGEHGYVWPRDSRHAGLLLCPSTHSLRRGPVDRQHSGPVDRRRIPDFDEALNNPEFTEAFLAYAAPYSAYSMPDVQIEDLTIDGPQGSILIRLYRPKAGGDRPGLLWVHGGAFVTGELDMPEAHVVSAEIAARGAVVAFGRLPAGHRNPAIPRTAR